MTDETATKSHRGRQKHFERVPYSAFLEGCRNLNLDPDRLCEAIGYTKGAFRPWQETGQMPKVASLAIEAHLRRRSQMREDAGGPPILLTVHANRLSVVSGNVQLKEIDRDIWRLTIGKRVEG